MGSSERKAKVKSLAKAMKVLECFLEKQELGVTEIGEMLGLYKSNVHDILVTFEALGYVEQNGRNGKYRMGLRVLELSHVIVNSMHFRETVFPRMRELSQQVGEMVYFGIPEGYDVLYLEAAYPTNVFATRAVLGARAPMYCTGIGKAMLSRMPESSWHDVAAGGLLAFTDRTLTTPQALIEDLRTARGRGYAIDNMEHELGIQCVGVPVISQAGQVIAGVSISGPSPRMEGRLSEYGCRLQMLSADIGKRL